ncbi:GGDEF domain-containing protein [Neptuniibacter caesariensis]|uniref:diguanylate cyclase n=1 Tax=Neptuniibacter caesariensis TaxID=207954 RepID=A0A7U8C890_NEPCE|nr:GGDEF domain-containing protein [Neptuniibacter caesariensis]EAR62446.1 GGDEF/HAMP domain protein [Oceanospirillum sp. MED92] [Neptuniibacter caesariensis]
MKRLLSLLITLAVLGVGLILSLTLFFVGKYEFESQVEQQVGHVHQQVRERFRVFDELIANDERELHKRARRALLRLSEVILHENFDPKDWDSERLAQLSKDYGVDAIYIIDRDTRVVATNFLPDMGFQLGTISEAFEQHLKKMFGTGRLEIDRINVSSKTGILQVYAYYAPLNSDYMLEVSYDVKNFLSHSHSSRYVEFLFGDFFTELEKTNPMLEKVDVYLVNNYAAFPFLQNTAPINASDLPSLPEKGVTTVNKENHIVHHYSRADLNRSTLHSAEYLVIRSTFNLTPIYSLMHKFLGISLVIILVVLGIAFFLLSFLFEKWILRRIFRIIAALERSAEGDYADQMISDRKDELGLIADHINSMNRRIAHRDVELREARNTLEHRVEERTRDLQLEVNARKKAEEELIKLASTDPLTRVLNRRAFDQRSREEIERSHRYNRELAIILLDIDHFKQINDQYGHQFGDKVLIDVANLIGPSLRAADCLCRHGGEEFIILLPETDEATALLIAERVRKSIAQHKITDRHDSLSITASFGVAVWRREEGDIQPAVYRADQAMYKAKNSGRNKVVAFTRVIQS